MNRRRLAIVCALGALAIAGCTDHGTYRVSWSFPDAEAGVGCGQHGVDSIHITGASSKGDSDDVVALCAGRQTPRAFTQEVPVGSWTFTFRQLDVRGALITVLDDQGQPVPDPTATGTVAADTTTDLDPATIVLTPRPVCSDGVDNDRDGRIDLDDPECGGDPNGAAECTAGMPGC
jgi:hypothetical protein